MKRLIALKVMLWVLGLTFIFLIGIPTLLPIKRLILFAELPWPEESMPALFFTRHAGAAWIGWGLVFLLAAKDPIRYISWVKLCFILMSLDVLASILNICFEGWANLSPFILVSYLLGLLVLISMGFLIPWKNIT